MKAILLRPACNHVSGAIRPLRTVATGLRATRLHVTRILAIPLVAIALFAPSAAADDVIPIETSVDAAGRIRIRIEASPDDYYVLYVREDLSDGAEEPVSMALGTDGVITLSEGLAAFPPEHYRVARYSRSEPGDLDGDGKDDVAEFTATGRLGPFNPAPEIAMRDGAVAIPDRETFETLSYEGLDVRIDTHLEDLEFVKFYLLEMDTESPQVYFMNSVTHRAHGDFARAIGLERGGGGGRGGGRDLPGQMRGEIVYHPNVVGPNGGIGVYRFEFEPNDAYPFEDVRRAYELIAKNMPLLRNDFTYYPMPNAALPRYEREKALYDASRVAILLEEDIYADVDYLPLNLAEGYGLLRVMGLDERPGPRDIVVYGALPNELPRVGGIITAVPQTPLSHVNLRAIQDRVPNAYVAGALDDPTIAGLVGRYVYYRVGAEDYEIRETTREAVEAHYAALRPAEPSVPDRDLAMTEVTSLDDLGFEDWRSVGVKAANVATMRTFGFPEGVVPEGFGVPFSFYHAFMEHNGLYDEVRAMLEDPDFRADYEVQAERLEALRDRIEDADMPEWMMTELAAMHAAFPAGASIRCRSSTNAEDLPTFSGAGLYDSFTHHPDEGHIAKSIKQVYASLWTFRAFDEREFYRIDHLATAMGVLVHENFEGERANGVGVTTDPLYGTEDTYYLNTQVGEDLVTNPDALSVPEEILLDAAPGGGHVVVRRSNQVPDDDRVLSDEHLEAMRIYLRAIDTEFRRLYGAEPGEPFAMDVEYKVTSEGQVSIKQARPWIFAEPLEPAEPGTPEPTSAAPTAAPPTAVAPSATPPTPTPGPPGGDGAEIVYLPFVTRRR